MFLTWSNKICWLSLSFGKLLQSFPNCLHLEDIFIGSIHLGYFHCWADEHWTLYLSLLCRWTLYLSLLCRWILYLSLLCRWTLYLSLLCRWTLYLSLLCRWTLYLSLLCRWTVTISFIVVQMDTLSFWTLFYVAPYVSYMILKSRLKKFT